VHRGLDKLDGRPTTTSTAAGAAPGPNQRGVDDATGAASGLAPTAPQARATAPHSGPTAGQAIGDVGATGYPPDKHTAGAATTTVAAAAEGGIRGHRSERDGNEQIATTAAPRDHPAAVDGPSVQCDTDVPQQGFDKRIAGDGQTADALQRIGNVARQE